MVVPPAPVILAVCTPQASILHVRPVSFNNPRVVIRNLNVIPHVIVPIIGIVATISHANRTTGLN
jgi:hypothetical protein